MEESAWLNMPKVTVIPEPEIVQKAYNIVIDDLVNQAAKELGEQAGKTWKEQVDSELEEK